MRKRGLTIGAVIGTLVGVLWASMDVLQDGHWIVVIAMLAAAGALVGAYFAQFIIFFRQLQTLADLPEKSKTEDAVRHTDPPPVPPAG